MPGNASCSYRSLMVLASPDPSLHAQELLSLGTLAATLVSTTIAVSVTLLLQRASAHVPVWSYEYITPSWVPPEYPIVRTSFLNIGSGDARDIKVYGAGCLVGHGGDKGNISSGERWGFSIKANPNKWETAWVAIVWYQQRPFRPGMKERRRWIKVSKLSGPPVPTDSDGVPYSEESKQKALAGGVPLEMEFKPDFPAIQGKSVPWRTRRDLAKMTNRIG